MTRKSAFVNTDVKGMSWFGGTTAVLLFARLSCVCELVVWPVDIWRTRDLIKSIHDIHHKLMRPPGEKRKMKHNLTCLSLCLATIHKIVTSLTVC